MSMAKVAVIGHVEPAAVGQAALAHENRKLQAELSRLRGLCGEAALAIGGLNFDDVFCEDERRKTGKCSCSTCTLQARLQEAAKEDL